MLTEERDWMDMQAVRSWVPAVHIVVLLEFVVQVAAAEQGTR